MKIKFYFSERNVESIMGCAGIGLPMLTWMTASEDYLLQQAVLLRGSLGHCRLFEQLEIDCRGSTNVFGTTAVMHTGEIEVNSGSMFALHGCMYKCVIVSDAAEQLAVSSGVKCLICHALFGCSTFVIKMDVFRSRAETGGQRGESTQKLPDEFLQLQVTGVHISASLYEHRF